MDNMDKRWQVWRLFLFAMLIFGLAGCADLPQTVKPDVHVTIVLDRDGRSHLMGEVAVHPLVDPTIQQLIESLREEAAQAEGVRNPEVKVTTREGRQYNTLLLHFNSPQDLNAFVGTPHLLNALLRTTIQAELPPVFSNFELAVERDQKQTPVRYTFNAEIPEDTVRALSGIQLTFHLQMPERIASHNADSVVDQTATWKVPLGGSLSMRAEAKASIWESARRSVERSFNERPLVVGAAGVVLLLAVVGLAALVWYKRQERSSEDWVDWGGPPTW